MVTTISATSSWSEVVAVKQGREVLGSTISRGKFSEQLVRKSAGCDRGALQGCGFREGLGDPGREGL